MLHLALGDNKYSGDTKYYIVDGIKDPIALTKGGAQKVQPMGAGMLPKLRKWGRI